MAPVLAAAGGFSACRSRGWPAHFFLSLREACSVLPRGLRPSRSGRLISVHCVEALCFAPRVKRRSGLARPRSLRPEAPPAATQQRASPPGPSLFSSFAETARRSQRLPAAMRALGPRGLRSNSRFTRGADGRPPTHAVGDPAAGRESWRRLWCASEGTHATAAAPPRGQAGGGWPRPPSGRRPMAPERAGPERRPRGGCRNAGPERQRGGNGEGLRRADLACSVARAGGSEGGARCAARATTAVARWARTDRPHAVKGKPSGARREPPGATHFPALSFARSASTWPACVPGFTSL